MNENKLYHSYNFSLVPIFIGGAGIITPELNFARHSCGVHRFFLFRLGADVDIRRLPLYVRPMLSGSICLDKLMF